MRDILFRGKSIDGGFWVEGSLRITTHQPTDGKPYKCYEIEDTTYGEFPDDFMCGICETVDHETVGQYTGKTVYNGKVFEGDILKSIDGIFSVFWDDEKSAFIMRFLEYPYENLYLEEMWYDAEIIGNIHDNPELLEV